MYIFLKKYYDVTRRTAVFLINPEIWSRKQKKVPGIMFALYTAYFFFKEI